MLQHVEAMQEMLERMTMEHREALRMKGALGNQKM
jgi:hypothetical protein